ncbi:MAG: four helix bundle protein [Bacteroidota bacterium]
MNAVDLKNRTKSFALSIIKLLKSVPRDFISEVLLKQLVRCSTSLAANYRSACRAKSRADFIHKIGTVEEEADEALFWLEMITESEILSLDKTKILLDEANQLTAIFTSIRKTTKENDKR